MTDLEITRLRAKLKAGQALADDLLWAAHQNDHGMVLTTAEVAEVRTSIALWNAAKGEI